MGGPHCRCSWCKRLRLQAAAAASGCGCKRLRLATPPFSRAPPRSEQRSALGMSAKTCARAVVGVALPVQAMKGQKDGQGLPSVASWTAAGGGLGPSISHLTLDVPTALAASGGGGGGNGALPAAGPSSSTAGQQAQVRLAPLCRAVPCCARCVRAASRAASHKRPFACLPSQSLALQPSQQAQQQQQQQPAGAAALQPPVGGGGGDVAPGTPRERHVGAPAAAQQQQGLSPQQQQTQQPPPQQQQGDAQQPTPTFAPWGSGPAAGARQVRLPARAQGGKGGTSNRFLRAARGQRVPGRGRGRHAAGPGAASDGAAQNAPVPAAMFVCAGVCICLDTLAGPEPSYRAYQVSCSAEAREPNPCTVRVWPAGGAQRHGAGAGGLVGAAVLRRALPHHARVRGPVAAHALGPRQVPGEREQRGEWAKRWEVRREEGRARGAR